jgi:hypothetical protein
VIEGVGNISGGTIVTQRDIRLESVGAVERAVPAPAESIPERPPPEVLAALDTAASALQDLDEAGIDVRLHLADAGSRVRVEVEGTDGVAHDVSLNRLLDFLSSGGGRSLILDERR